ncbi:hypothetical protein GP486_002146 [Trichoglossum hirsutum]|uniref:EKC/KEOPS complex subunit GON7 n=1 Tax=Trichoglossum hirsutum TaxID=265104 RepID=A0A9P8LFJ6_9PEZI|nr:hypothetical protein GP486_002146 [Trichoglossum hirsutum]
MASSPSSTASLQARYRSPNVEKLFDTEPEGSKDKSRELLSTADKVAYLAALRSSVAKLQGEVNAFLTRRMDEGKAAAAAGVAGGGKRTVGVGVDDEREEENYGEEVVDEEA